MSDQSWVRSKKQITVYSSYWLIWDGLPFKLEPSSSELVQALVINLTINLSKLPIIDIVLHELPLPQVDQGIQILPGLEPESPCIGRPHEDHEALLDVERVERHVEQTLELDVVVPGIDQGIGTTAEDELLIGVLD